MADGRARNQVDGTGWIRIFGVPIRFHFTFLILLIFILVVGLSGGQSAAANALYLIALFTSVLLHELGHVLVARRYGIRTVEITMYPIGGVARPERTPAPNEEIWIGLAGPLVNLVIAGLLLGYVYVTGQLVHVSRLSVPSDANLIQRIGTGNLLLAAFNLIPAFPMDGGRVLRGILARFRPVEQATQMAATAGQYLAILMGLFGLLSANFFLIFIAFFVYLGAAQESAHIIGQTLTHGVPVRAAMVTDFRTLSHGDSMRDAANLLLATSQQDFPVVLGDQVIGLLGRNALLRTIAVDGPEAYVASAMDRDFKQVEPNADLGEALPVLSEAGSCALVMDEGRLLGLLTRENLSEFLLLRRFGLKV